jgi:hypothetical protein
VMSRLHRGRKMLAETIRAGAPQADAPAPELAQAA